MSEASSALRTGMPGDRLDTAGLEAALDRLETACSGRLGIAARRLDTGAEVCRNATERFRTASAVKVAVHAAVLARGLDLERRVPVGDTDRIGGSGVLNVLGEGIQPTIQDLCTLMIVVSDNTATNMLIDLVGGVAVVNEVARASGFGEIELHRRLVSSPPPLAAGPQPPLAEPIGTLATGTPEAFCRMMAAIHAGTLVSSAASARMLATLEHQQDRNGVPRALLDLPEPGEREPGLPWLAAKTGYIPGCRVDTGILTLPGGPAIAYAVMADELADCSMTALSEGDELLGRVGAALARRWWPATAPVGVRDGWP